MLIEELKTARGRFGGTYACRELVIAYAAWISAAFHLKAIRVFLDASAGVAAAAVAAPAPKLPPRNLLRERVGEAFHACKLSSGNVGVTIRIPDAIFTRHRLQQLAAGEFA